LDANRALSSIPTGDFPIISLRPLKTVRQNSSAVRLFTVACAFALPFLLVGATFVAGSSRPSSGSVIGKLGGERSATVWAVGDGGDGGPAAVRIAKRVVRDDPDLFLYLGDVYETGTAQEYRKLYKPVYRRLDRITAPTPGNHEWPLHAVGYDPYWRKVMRKPLAPWYRISVAGWDVFSLNSEAPHTEGSPQMQWLRSKLRGSGTCRLAFWHRPLYAGGMHAGDADVSTFWDALRGKAALVVNGHDHNMQRYKPVDGITELVAGAGGHGLHPILTPDPNRTFENDSAYGALRLELRSGRASFRYISASGKKLNSGRVQCNAGT
jgi:hypothetical protein